ncbi:hypothetical protein ZHAS_00000638 [Anopheles sinensis]|uniref:Uncharacterized protein n=1 Tax=Anopheles sinensis TaxID=74873 RepID=A0A084VAE2_ANOSI|nr:hypothetical protein ZHAS_00000638 [Anopheles sinensis]
MSLTPDEAFSHASKTPARTFDTPPAVDRWVGKKDGSKFAHFPPLWSTPGRQGLTHLACLTSQGPYTTALARCALMMPHSLPVRDSLEPAADDSDSGNSREKFIRWLGLLKKPLIWDSDN